VRRVAVCYSLDGNDADHLAALRHRLDIIHEGAADVGFVSYAHIRDRQLWHIDGADPVAALRAVLNELPACDVVLLDLTPHGHSRFTGLAIEAGYALSIGKPMLALWPERVTPSRMLAGIAARTETYVDVADLRSAVARGLQALSYRGS
jgi:hypothetical protein